LFKRTSGTDTEVLTVLNQNGNVGIGSTTPTQKFVVVGDIGLTGNIVDTNTNETITIASNDVHFQGKHINAEFGVWVRSPTASQRINGIDASSNELQLFANSAERVRIDTAGQVGIGTTDPQETLHVNGSVRIDSTYNLDSATATLATISQTSILSVSATTFGSAKFLIQAYDTVTGERQISELLVVHDGTTTYDTEYAILKTGANVIATFATDINGGNLRLLATGASTNSTQYKVKQTLMLA
jgi:hypothetical protein